MSILETLLIVYVFAGCVYWLYVALGVVRAMRTMPRLARLEPPEPADWPRLSLIVPACNEADSIDGAVRSMLAQDYPELEVVLIDDRSTDATPAIVDRLAHSDPRVVGLHVDHLPEGWLGKVNAMARGVDEATGDWLLFIDADVHLEPGTLRKTVAYCLDAGLDHMAVVPGMWRSSFLVDASVAMFLRLFAVVIRAWAVSRPGSRAYAGVGAFNLVRREAFDRTEGFSWLRLEVIDDMGLALMLKRHGARACLADGVGLLGLYWHRSVAEIARGAEKAYAVMAGTRLPGVLILSMVVVLLELAPLAAFLPLGVPGLWPAGVAMLLALLLTVAIGHRRAKRPVLSALLWPVGLAVNLSLLVRSVWLGARRGGIVWRDTFYPTPLLLAHQRVRLL